MLIRPLYLPFGQFVYALRTAAGFQLEVAGKPTVDALDPIDADAGASQSNSLTCRAIAFLRTCCAMAASSLSQPIRSALAQLRRCTSSIQMAPVSNPTAAIMAQPAGAAVDFGDVVFTHGKRWRDSLRRSRMKRQSPRRTPSTPARSQKQPAGDWLISARNARLCALRSQA